MERKDFIKNSLGFLGMVVTAPALLKQPYTAAANVVDPNSCGSTRQCGFGIYFKPFDFCCRDNIGHPICDGCFITGRAKLPESV